MAGKTRPISERTIARLSLYRRLLNVLQAEGAGHVVSRQLADLAGRTAAQVRRDLMVLGYAGASARGYEVAGLIQSMRQFLDHPSGQDAALVGVGNLGKALLTHFSGRRPNLAITAAFDSDPTKANRSINACRVWPMDRLARVVRARDIRVAIIAVPPEVAQGAADRLVAAGVRGILNFAPVRLRVPDDVYVEDLDMTVSLEKVAYFARRGEANEM
ncbi:MAG: redox-sensing transcriptional repressor Rex [Planctomycetota bacterium]|nr:redox-sensing transcriptional repressor Rex [Planctomycetota bacterium]